MRQLERMRRQVHLKRAHRKESNRVRKAHRAHAAHPSSPASPSPARCKMPLWPSIRCVRPWPSTILGSPGGVFRCAAVCSLRSLLITSITTPLHTFVLLCRWGIDNTFDCTGITAVMRDALESSHRGWGKCCIIGMLLHLALEPPSSMQCRTFIFLPCSPRWKVQKPRPSNDGAMF